MPSIHLPISIKRAQQTENLNTDLSWLRVTYFHTIYNSTVSTGWQRGSKLQSKRGQRQQGWEQKQTEPMQHWERGSMRTAAQDGAVKHNLADHEEGCFLPSGSPLWWLWAFTLIKLKSPKSVLSEVKKTIYYPSPKTLALRGKVHRYNKIHRVGKESTRGLTADPGVGQQVGFPVKTASTVTQMPLSAQQWRALKTSWEEG